MSDDKEDVKENLREEHIVLKVMSDDHAGVMQFSIKKQAPLGKVMRAYCKRVGKDVTVTRFRFDGEVVNQSDTALSLQMEDGDTIEVFQQQVAGC